MAGVLRMGSTLTVTVDSNHEVMEFQNNTDPIVSEVKYKTVNIYSSSLPSWKAILIRLEEHISAGWTSGYYETIFSELVDENSISLGAVYFDNNLWYEVDTIGDLAVAKKLFPTELSEIIFDESLISEIA